MTVHLTDQLSMVGLQPGGLVYHYLVYSVTPASSLVYHYLVYSVTPAGVTRTLCLEI